MISVVIPAYNEAQRLPRALGAVHAYLTDNDLDAEIIVVDDGSADETSDVARRCAEQLGMKNLTTIRLQPNRGKGAAVRAGVLTAKGEITVMSDADMSTPISELPKLLQAIGEGFDVAVGSRYLDRDLLEVRQPWYREVSAAVYNRAVQGLMLPGIRDTQCGFKGFKTEVAREIFEPLLIQGFAFDVEVLYRAHRRGMTIKEVPVRWRDEAGSTVRPLKHAVTSSLSLIKIRLQTR